MFEKSIFTNALANYWPDFVNCNQRLKSLGPFLMRILLKYKEGVIFDAAMGIGCESTFLIQKGFKVVSNEIDENLIRIANNFAKKQDVKLNITSDNWFDLCADNEHDLYDAVIIIGNSICLLNDEVEILYVLNNLYKLLKPGGTIIIDERNFSYMLSNRNKILSGNFRYSYNYIYCGKEIKGIPIKISREKIRFGYFDQNNSMIGTLEMYPFDIFELRGLLQKSKFKNIQVFSDFVPGYDDKADFFIYTAMK